MNTVSFPGLGILPFDLQRVAIAVGPVKIYWYGIIICTGILAALIYINFRFKQIGMNSDNLADIALFTIPIAIIGARAYYVLTTIKDGFYQSFYDVIAIWDGGIAIYGAVIAGAITVMLVCKFKKFKTKAVLDCIAPAVMLGQIIGRWGNFVNCEAYGSASTYAFFSKVFDITDLSAKNPLRMTVNGMLCHPTFLYESAWNLLGFIVINIFYKKKKFDGEIALWYLGWYGFGRMFIEGFRTDSLYVSGIRISQLIGLLCFVVGTVLIIIYRNKKRSEEKYNGSNY